MSSPKQIRFWPAILISIILLVISGYTYRLYAKKLDALTHSPLLPQIPLSQFPLDIGFWKGMDVPLSDTVLKVAANEDHISRRYRNEQTQAEVNLYLAYTSQPRNMLGHRPRVCYVNSGWIHEDTKNILIHPAAEETTGCLLHTFLKQDNNSIRLSVLNYYILNGQVTTDHNLFSGLRYRSLRSTRKNPRYVAQIQVNSRSSREATAFTELIEPLILSYMPEIKP